MLRSIYFSTLAVVFSFLTGCSGGGGGGDTEGGAFAVIGVSLAPNQQIGLNQPIEVLFNMPVDLTTVSLGSTISIVGQGQGPSLPPIPSVQGTFSLKPGANDKILIFRPTCPSNATDTNGGLYPSDSLAQVLYTFSVLEARSTAIPVVKSVSGERLSHGVTFHFRTNDQLQPYADLNPGAPRVINQAAISTSAGLNLFADPNAPIEIVMDQPVRASMIQNDWFFLRFEEPPNSGNWVPIPGALVLTENCNDAGGSKFVFSPRGILPASRRMRLIQNETLIGLGGSDDHLPTSTVIQEIQIGEKSPVHPDAIVESFDDSTNEDVSTPLIASRAEWGTGMLQAASPFPGPTGTLPNIEIGRFTQNGPYKIIDTNSSQLTGTLGEPIPVVGGKIYCNNFTLKRDTTPTNPIHGKLEGIGPNALEIIATGTVTFETGTIVTVDGGGSSESGGITSGTGTAGGQGVCGGGDGGSGVPGSTAQGENGNGPFNAPGVGGQGGHSGYGATVLMGVTIAGGPPAPGPLPMMQVRPGGGGGGSFLRTETDGYATGPFPYGRHTFLFIPYSASGPWGNPNCVGTTGPQTGVPAPPLSNMGVQSGNPPCNGGGLFPTNTAGEAGGNGPTGLAYPWAQNPPLPSEMDSIAMSDPVNPTYPPGGAPPDDGPLISETPLPIYDAQTGQAGPLGGAPGNPVFTGTTDDDFFGTKIRINAQGQKEIIAGELTTPVGGSGGGAGGDALSYPPQFPPPIGLNPSSNDFQGGGAGAGGGIFRVRAIGPIVVDGELRSDGGIGGSGDLHACVSQAGGGGGGGSGGMIILESLTRVDLGSAANSTIRVHATPGDRGFGSSRQNGPDPLLNEKCTNMAPCLQSPFPNPPGTTPNWIYECRNENANAFNVQGFPARSKRNFAYSRGGAGAKGQVIVGIPHDLDTGAALPSSLTVLGTDVSAGNCPGGGNFVRCFDQNQSIVRFNEISTSFVPLSAANAGPRLDPDPIVIQPTFGALSQALSQWRYLGSASTNYQFSGTNGQGFVDFNQAEQTLAMGTGNVQIVAGNQVLISDSALYGMIAGNPKVLVADHLKFENHSERFSIVNVLLIPGASPAVRLYLDPNDGPIPNDSSWQIVRRCFDVVAGSMLNGLPANTSIKVEFQGADETSLGSGVPNLNSIVPSATTYYSNPVQVNGKRFIRYLVSFDLLQGAAPDSTLPQRTKPSFEFLKLPFEF